MATRGNAPASSAPNVEHLTAVKNYLIQAAFTMS